MADIKEKVICPWCKEEMRPYPHQGYYWFQCKCGARTPTLWHATEEQTRKRALSYTVDVVPKSEVENYKQIAEKQQKLAIDRYFEIKRLKEELANAKTEVAREIFEEIEHKFCGAYWYKGYTVEHHIAELKKKYTEEKQ